MARASATELARDTAASGLTSTAAADRLRADGPNVLPIARPAAAWRKLLAELTHFFALMLWVAAVLALFAGMPQLAVAIVVVIVVNGVFASCRRKRARRRRSGSGTSCVGGDRPSRRRSAQRGRLRGGGGRRPGAVRWRPDPRGRHVIVADDLAVDESTLTGESEPVHRSAGAGVSAGPTWCPDTGKRCVPRQPPTPVGRHRGPDRGYSSPSEPARRGTPSRRADDRRSRRRRRLRLLRVCPWRSGPRRTTGSCSR